MRTQWTTKGNRNAGSSCSCDRGLHRYLRNFGGGFWTPQTTPLGTPLKNIPQLICDSYMSNVFSYILSGIVRSPDIAHNSHQWYADLKF